ncbi:MAG: hypothetical protein JW733_01090 [Coriobacteriia bacterium]|nr:hypothetical protein [Coriobacteriia bacterium]MBN2847965.1 hypothetical protein [Coriobacteriia bacterium]
MDEGTTPSGWRDIDRRHRAGILLGVAVVLAAVVAGAVALSGGEPGAVPDDETTRTITPAEQAAEATGPIPSYEPTGTSSVESSSAPPVAGPDALPAPTRLAYRREGWLCVAALDGSAEQRVAESASGVFSLSPDGATIASVDADRHLRLYDVATGSARDLGPMEDERPSWSPDSEAVVYTAPGPTVRRYARRGGRQAILFAGRAPVYTRDGAAIVALSPSTEEPAVLVWQDERLERRALEAPGTSVACYATHIYAGTAPDADGEAALLSMPLDGSARPRKLSAATSARGVSIGSLIVSPDGSRVAYAEQGDDGHSRVYVMPVAGGTAVQASGRRDACPLQWADDGDTLLLIEGNPVQGEPTALVSVSITSGVRKLVIEGAGR